MKKVQDEILQIIIDNNLTTSKAKEVLNQVIEDIDLITSQLILSSELFNHIKKRQQPDKQKSGNADYIEELIMNREEQWLTTEIPRLYKKIAMEAKLRKMGIRALILVVSIAFIWVVQVHLL